MPPLTDPDRRKAYLDALGNWNCTDYVQFELSEQAQRWIRTKLGTISRKEIARLMCEYVEAGGKVDETVEQRPEWRDEFEFHHDLRFSIEGVEVYIETRLIYRLPVKEDESYIIVVNIHER